MSNVQFDPSRTWATCGGWLGVMPSHPCLQRFARPPAPLQNIIAIRIDLGPVSARILAVDPRGQILCGLASARPGHGHPACAQSLFAAGAVAVATLEPCWADFAPCSEPITLAQELERLASIGEGELAREIAELFSQGDNS